MKKEKSETLVDTPQIKSGLNFDSSKIDKIAIFIANTFGSMSFLVACTIFFTFWICVNAGLIPVLKPFDLFPFSTLKMVVSIFAIILSILCW